MTALLKRLTNLNVVSIVLQSPAKYPSTYNGFTTDRQKLQGDVNRVTSILNSNLKSLTKHLNLSSK